MSDQQHAKAWRQFLKDANIDGAGDYQETLISIKALKEKNKKLREAVERALEYEQQLTKVMRNSDIERLKRSLDY